VGWEVVFFWVFFPIGLRQKGFFCPSLLFPPTLREEGAGSLFLSFSPQPIEEEMISVTFSSPSFKAVNTEVSSLFCLVRECLSRLLPLFQDI